MREPPEEPKARRIPAHSPPPPGAVRCLDEDWLRIWYDEEDSAVAIEVHEMCTHKPCPFHPPGCDCSEGECQT